ncbi:tetrapyrrole methyltransferase [Bifidobacterium myosotis]|uniref:Tetrapyrrole methyltransferase n=1 Tax=Bifidobacterium myosotis TaxID=1630166 RepID=A0A261FDP5_9BIFI|nr:MazG nucleotide pyrophosphohydrolase domain-containing protein [Bifidobacterium myosotis]OZG57093.1 tetrapyrrole methyltransferase [Bifidobacterium myosotis]
MNDSGVGAMQANRDPQCRTQYRLPDGFEHCSKLKPVTEAATALDRVKAVVDVLYSPGGCPWDGKQTNESLLKNLLEETYEYVDAVETHDRANMREELGDVLLQSVFQARVCESDAEDPFDIDEVADRLVNKLITRHPHVFAADAETDPDSAPDAADTTDTTNTADSADGGDNAKDGNASLQQESPEAVLALWEKMKQQEKHRTSVLEGISQSQGALPRAAKVVSRISKSPNADELFKAFDETPLSKGQHDDERHAAGRFQEAEQSALNGDVTSEREKADAYANAILDIVRKARIDGIDIEAALRNRLRDVESRVADIESHSRA